MTRTAGLPSVGIGREGEGWTVGMERRGKRDEGVGTGAGNWAGEEEEREGV